MTDPQIVGWTHSQFGKSEAPDTEALMAEVTGPALAHAGIPAEEVDGIFVGVFNNGFSDQDFQGALVGMGDERLARRVAFRTRAQANEPLALSRRDVTRFDGARCAWAAAYDRAGIGVGDLSLVETHDCFTIAELLEYEAMGLTEPGQGARAIREGWMAQDGRLPVNPSGGLKSKGHPIGATGVSMHVMASMQLTGEAGEMQVPGATLAGVFNMGGAAVANYASGLERVG